MKARELLACLVAFVVPIAATATADIAPEAMHQNRPLDPPAPHWAVFLDLNPADISKARYVVFDADTAEFKTHIATGQFPTLHASPDGSEVYVVESWLLGPRQTREDYVSIYDTKDYSLSGVIELPGRRRALMAPRNRTALVAGRYLVVFNFTPGTSVTVVDTQRRVVLGTVPTPGCSLVYPTGESAVSMICGDGTLLTLRLNADGKVASQARSDPFFDPDTDPIIENGVPIDGLWYFPSYSGDVYPVDLRADTPVLGDKWALVDHSKKPAGFLATLFTGGKAGPWLPGGFQLATVHESRRELYVLMHPIRWSESKGDHVFPGPEVWVYDVDAKKRVKRIELRGVGLSVHVTPDSKPLLLVGGADIDTQELSLEVYDATTGKFLREMSEHGDAVFHIQGVTGR